MLTSIIIGTCVGASSAVAQQHFEVSQPHAYPSERDGLQAWANTSKHYPPAPDTWANLTWALSGPGAPGIYNSSHTPDSQYGIYNWCNMPHVRNQEYKAPGEEYKLVYVEAVQRHHKRTPYASNTLRHEDVTWRCNDAGPYAHARASSFSTTPVYWQSMTGTVNPFEKTVGPGFVNSTCRFPSITTEGLEDARQHGEDFRSVYADRLGFLPPSSNRDMYSFRVTNNVITSATLGAFVSGLYPAEEEYEAWVQPETYDSLEPSFPCPAASKLLIQIRQEAGWQLHLNASAALMGRFDAVAGLGPDDKGWHISYDHAYDNLSAKQCHGLRLPCSANNATLCVPQSDADMIYRLGHWEYAYMYRVSNRSTAFSALRMGAWFGEVADHLRTAAAGDKIKYRHNFAHDGSMAAILGLLQFAKPMWPGTGAEVVIELWKKGSEPRRDFVRVLWSGQPLETNTPLGTLDMVPLPDFLRYLEQTIPPELVSACAS
ncbi:hypothetical protein CspeluHIS016_0207740 [Cutaneotrichosporon spelunceum]|uniref:Phosphoglycerate mutase-like protein n=1 Tax=Cutaneotrichosporon spelunceum TaxID=1672016 RepID=A0AAD3YB46_9TREE|nr:hypothetical protein CspeluHIS016_0207740 [Cutaneotrichosporon spelunceum]